ncbi:MAG: hypothetical protein AAFY17_12200 [Cyanobacteria bacterium J06642_11]
MSPPSLIKLRTYLHLVPIFGTLFSLWTLYGEATTDAEDLSEQASLDNAQESAQRIAASKLSVILGLGCVSAIALLGAAASTQASQAASLRFLLSSSFIGSGYFLLSLALMFRVATNRSIRLPGISQLSRRLP